MPHPRSFLRSLIEPFSRRSSRGLNSEFVHSESTFSRLIAKEISRCVRRPRHHEFSIIQLEGILESDSKVKQHAFFKELYSRLRITDELGVWKGHFALLLPETGRDGAAYVANTIEVCLKNHGLKSELALFVYPWDDRIAGSSSELDSVESDDTGEPTVRSEDEQILTAGNTWSNQVVGSAVATKPQSVTAPIQCSPGRDVFLKKIEASFSMPTPVWKRAIDIAGSAVLLFLLSPFFAVIAVMIRRDSPGAAIFTQAREGKDGKHFRIYKFRTMCVGADEEQQLLRQNNEQDGPAFKLKDDPRVTRLGRYLRKSCVDELPQLINVLRGEMSLVGPRPLPIRESVQCSMWHRQRLDVLPGLTCIWQVFGGRQVSFEEWMRMDLEYIKKRSLLLDLKLIFFTVVKVALHKGSV
jgi:lipopolysaccharide/colanic/teichoic acid biosynthesis glycosyltransferase